MKKVLLVFALACQSVQALDKLLPTMVDKQREVIKEQRKQAQEGQPITAPPALLRQLAWQSKFPQELAERQLRSVLAHELQTCLAQTVPGLPRDCQASLIALSPQGTRLAIAGALGNSLLLNVVTGDRTVLSHQGITSLSFNASESLLALSVRYDDVTRINLLNCADFTHLLLWSDGGGNNFQFNTRGDGLVRACLDGDHVLVEAAATDRRAAWINPNFGPIKALTTIMFPDGEERVITSHEEGLKILSRVPYPTIPRPEETAQNAEHRLSVSPQGSYCALTRGAYMHMYDARTWQLLYTYLASFEPRTSKIIFGPSDETFAYANDTHIVQRHSRYTQKLRTWELENRSPQWVSRVDFTPDLSKAVVCWSDGTVRMLYPQAHATLRDYFVKTKRPLNQQLLVWLLFTYRELINSDPKKPNTAILINDVVRCFANGIPTLTVEGLEQARNTMPHDVQRALAQYFGIYKKRNAAS